MSNVFSNAVFQLEARRDQTICTVSISTWYCICSVSAVESKKFPWVLITVFVINSDFQDERSIFLSLFKRAIAGNHCSARNTMAGNNVKYVLSREMGNSNISYK